MTKSKIKQGAKPGEVPSEPKDLDDLVNFLNLMFHGFKVPTIVNGKEGEAAFFTEDARHAQARRAIKAYTKHVNATLTKRIKELERIIALSETDFEKLSFREALRSQLIPRSQYVACIRKRGA